VMMVEEVIIYVHGACIIDRLIPPLVVHSSLLI
jgi:hypothetical protein